MQNKFSTHLAEPTEPGHHPFPEQQAISGPKGSFGWRSEQRMVPSLLAAMEATRQTGVFHGNETVAGQTEIEAGGACHSDGPGPQSGSQGHRSLRSCRGSVTPAHYQRLPGQLLRNAGSGCLLWMEREILSPYLLQLPVADQFRRFQAGSTSSVFLLQLQQKRAYRQSQCFWPNARLLLNGNSCSPSCRLHARSPCECCGWAASPSPWPSAGRPPSALWQPPIRSVPAPQACG